MGRWGDGEERELKYHYHLPLLSPPPNLPTSSFFIDYLLRKIEAYKVIKYLFFLTIHEKTVFTVTILLRKFARCILGTCNLVLTLLRRQRKTTFLRPAVGGWSFLII